MRGRSQNTVEIHVFGETDGPEDGLSLHGQMDCQMTESCSDCCCDEQIFITLLYSKFHYSH
jgi:hypothetical protein